MTYKKMYLVSSGELQGGKMKAKRKKGEEGSKEDGKLFQATVDYAKKSPQQINQTKVVTHGGRVNFYQNANPPPSPFHSQLLFRKGKLLPQVTEIEERGRGKKEKKRGAKAAVWRAPVPTSKLGRATENGNNGERGRRSFSPPSQPSARPAEKGDGQFALWPRGNASSAGGSSNSSSSVNLQLPSFSLGTDREERGGEGRDAAAARRMGGDSSLPYDGPFNEGVMERSLSSLRADLDELKESVSLMNEAINRGAASVDQASRDVIRRIQALHQNLLTNVEASLESVLSRHKAMRERELSQSTQEVLSRTGELLSTNLSEVRGLLATQSELIREQNALVLQGLRDGQQQQQQQQLSRMGAADTTAVALPAAQQQQQQETYSMISNMQSTVTNRIGELFEEMNRYQREHISGELSRILGAINEMNNLESGRLAGLFRSLTDTWGQRTMQQLTAVQDRLSSSLESPLLALEDRSGERDSRRENRNLNMQVRRMMGRLESLQAEFFEQESRRLNSRNEALLSALRQGTYTISSPLPLPAPSTGSLPRSSEQATLLQLASQLALPAPSAGQEGAAAAATAPISLPEPTSTAIALPPPPSNTAAATTAAIPLPAPSSEVIALPPPSPSNNAAAAATTTATEATPQPAPSSSSPKAGTSAERKESMGALGKRGEKRKDENLQNELEKEISFSDSASEGEIETYNLRRRSGSQIERRRQFNREMGEGRVKRQRKKKKKK